MKKRMIKLMTIFCMAGILTVNPAIIGLAEEAEAVGGRCFGRYGRSRRKIR